METAGPSGLSRPRRLTASQAITLFQNLNDSDNDDVSDLDLELDSESDSDDEYNPSLSVVSSLGSCFRGTANAVRKNGGRKRKRTRVVHSGDHVENNDSDGEDRSRSRSRSLQMNDDNEWYEVRVGADQNQVETYNSFRFLPHSDPGINVDLITENSSVLDCFRLLFDDEVIGILVQAINEYADKRISSMTADGQALPRRSRFRNWKPVSKYHILKFSAITMAMGIDDRPALIDYFSKHIVFCTPFYSDIFSKDEFLLIYSSMLHCGEANAEGKSKIEPFMTKLVDKFNHVFTPFQNISIDEMIVGFKGRWLYKQFNPQKPSKYHIKSFGLVDSSTGYVVDLLTYYGKNTSYDPTADEQGGQAVRIFHTLLNRIGKGYHIFADRFYTTRNLVNFLLEEKQYYTGTLMTNRRGFPAAIKKLSLRHKESKYWIQKENKILVASWKDKKAKKPVVIISTNATAEDLTIEGREKPAVIHSYNASMGGCDLADQKVGYYGIHNRKSKKWWKKLFHWILEIACTNAHILFVMSRPDAAKKPSLKKFKLDLIVSLLTEAATIIPEEERNKNKKKTGRPSMNPITRLQGANHIIEYIKQDRRCQVCSTPQKPARTHFICPDCPDQPHLHPKDCFKRWHKEPNLFQN